MKKLNLKDILIPVISLFLICAVSTALLAVTNGVTAPLIAENDKKTELAARQIVLPEAVSFNDKELTVEGTSYSYAEGLDGSGEVVGYIFTSSANGYGGAVQVMTGRDLEGTITSVEVLSCADETPGLGQNSKKPEWRAQFAKKSGELTVVKSDPADSEIQAITSATITSKAVTSAVNETYRLFTKITTDKTAKDNLNKGGEING